MTCARRTALAAVLGASLAFAFGPASVAAPLARPLEASEVLLRYVQAMAAVSRPNAVEFDYTVEQLGTRTLQQTHRVYRTGESERDEIIAADGQVLSRPTVRILLNRKYPYDVHSLAPLPADYTFIYTGTLLEGADHFLYTFRTEPKGLATSNFAVDEIAIDGVAFLPVTIHFRISGENVHGSGRVEYALYDKYWLVREATVTVHLPKGTLANERLVWSKYQFPPSLPAETFKEPLSVPTSPEE